MDSPKKKMFFFKQNRKENMLN